MVIKTKEEKLNRVKSLLKQFKSPELYSCRNYGCCSFDTDCGNNCLTYPLEGYSSVVYCPNNFTL